jgi:hypothetical protein
LREKHGLCGCVLCCVVSFEQEITEDGKALIREHLKGKNLACWCPLNSLCHADILLCIANGWKAPRLPQHLSPEMAA